MEPEVSPSQIASFLAVVKPDFETTFYINEIRLTAKAKIKRLQPAVVAGDPVYHDDIADIATAELLDREGQPIAIPPDCGVTLILSGVGGEGPLLQLFGFGPDRPHEHSDLEQADGPHRSPPDVSGDVFDHRSPMGPPAGMGLVPVRGLSHEDRKGLIGWAKNSRKPVPVLEEMARRFLTDFDVQITAWAKYEHLKSREDFFRRAKERLDAGDFLGCVNVLYPQIEGVMRSLYVAETAKGKPSQGTMASNLVENQFEHSVLLPEATSGSI